MTIVESPIASQYSRQTASQFSVGWKAIASRVLDSAASGMTRIASGVPMRQTQISPSVTLALASDCESGENAKLRIGPRVCGKVASSLREVMSQILTSGDGPPVASRLPSGLVAIEKTDPSSGAH